MTSRDTLTQTLADTVKVFSSKLGGRIEPTSSAPVYAQAAAALGISQAATVQRIHKLETLGLLRLTHEGGELRAVIVRRDALAEVELFERKQAERANSKPSLKKRLRHACEVGRPSAALKLWVEPTRQQQLLP